MREEVVAKRRQPQQSAQEMFPRLSSPYMSSINRVRRGASKLLMDEFNRRRIDVGKRNR